MANNDNRDRFAHHPFSTKNIELYLVGELDSDTVSRIEKLSDKNPHFNQYIETLKSKENPQSFSEVFAHFQNETSSERVAQRAPQNQAVDLLNRLMDFLAAPFYRQLAGAVTALLIVGFTTLYVVQSTQNGEKSIKVLAKGDINFFLFLNDERVTEKSTRAVRPGTLLTLQYKNSDDFYAMILYKDDAGPLQRYIAQENQAVVVPFSLKPVTYPKAIKLQDDFTKEQLWIAVSDVPFTFSEVGQLIHNPSGQSAITLKTYQLIMQR
ncbi:MAG: hypothetical protein OCC49_13710 [Fibrobacterales bacterium]